jgi:hypothetical protein
MNEAVGMPWMLGCCCAPLFTARNVLRYHHRVHTSTSDELVQKWACGRCSNDLFEECFLPRMASKVASQFFGVVGLLALIPAYLWITAQVVAESKSKRADPQYLVGFHEFHAEQNVNLHVMGIPPAYILSDNAIELSVMTMARTENNDRNHMH